MRKFGVSNIIFNLKAVYVVRLSVSVLWLIGLPFILGFEGFKVFSISAMLGALGYSLVSVGFEQCLLNASNKNKRVYAGILWAIGLLGSVFIVADSFWALTAESGQIAAGVLLGLVGHVKLIDRNWLYYYGEEAIKLSALLMLVVVQVSSLDVGLEICLAISFAFVTSFPYASIARTVEYAKLSRKDLSIFYYIAVKRYFAILSLNTLVKRGDVLFVQSLSESHFFLYKLLKATIVQLMSVAHFRKFDVWARADREEYGWKHFGPFLLLIGAGVVSAIICGVFAIGAKELGLPLTLADSILIIGCVVFCLFAINRAGFVARLYRDDNSKALFIGSLLAAVSFYTINLVFDGVSSFAWVPFVGMLSTALGLISMNVFVLRCSRL